MIEVTEHPATDEEGPSELSADDILSWAEAMMRGAASNFCKDGYLHPVVMLLVPACELMQHGGFILATTRQVLNARAKAAFLAQAKQVAQEQHAYAVLFVAEVWCVRVKGLLPAMTPEQARVERAKLGELSQHPDRTERLIASLESPQGLRVWKANIARDGNTVTCAPFVEDPNAATRMVGNHAGFIAKAWN